MEGSKQPSESDRGHGADAGGVSMIRLVLPSLVVLIGVAVLGYLLLERMASVEDGLAGFDARLTQIAEQTQDAADGAARAAEDAETALARAVVAEENAIGAARAGALAEEARITAEAERAEARAIAASAVEEAAQAQAEVERIELERQLELDRLERALSEIVETRRTALGLVMNLGSDAIEFEFDRAVLGANDRELLSRIAGILLTSTGYSVFVYGHTDDVGTEEYNQLLSERRAQSVRDYLVEAGIGSAIITTKGYGKSSPRVSSTNQEARARNRRVEIGIVDVRLDYLGEAPAEP